MRFLATADTDIGLVKTTNQDSLLIKHAKSPLGEIVMAIVCDGMGGLDKGEIASAVVIRRFDRWFNEELPVELEHLDLKVIGGKWSLLLKELNSKISEYASRTNSTMGTTFTGILLIDGKYVAAHVGDSRLYLINDDIRQITMDHSLVEELIRSGQLERNKGRNHPEKNIITRAMGSRDEALPDFFEIGLSPGDRILMCSDGLSNMVENDELRDIVRENEDVREAVDALVERANYYGGNDNISAVVIAV